MSINYRYAFQVNIIRIPLQFEYFRQYQQRLSGLIGANQAKKLVKNAVVLMTLGGNDFVNNYYLVPYSARSRQYALPNYVRFIISEYKKILMVCIMHAIIYYIELITIHSSLQICVNHKLQTID